MNWQKTIYIFAFLGLRFTAQAQDSTLVPLAKEQTNVTALGRDQLYASPALKIYQRQISYASLVASYRKYTQDLYLQQEGSGQQYFSLQAETYQKKVKNLTLWGNAAYSSETQYAVKFNETADYQLVYPYVMADSIGGDLKAETYSFSGGLAKTLGQYQVAGTVGFRGQQSYRSRDPRPVNISSDVNIDLAISRKINNKYAIAADVLLNKYSQKNKLSFVSELGQPVVYHDAGLGVYNKLLVGSLLNAWYNGVGYGFSLKISPTDYRGFFAGFDLHQSDIKKRTSKSGGNDIYEVGSVEENNMGGNAGYLLEQGQHHFIVQGSVNMVERKGIEAIFDVQNSENNINKISSSPRYIHQYETYHFRSVYGHTGGYLDWYIGAQARYEDHTQRYVSPDREMLYQQLTAGGDITLRKQLGKKVLTLSGKLERQENLGNDFYWSDVDQKTAIYSMLTSNFAYLTASGLNYGGSVRIDFPLKNKLSCYIKAAYEGRNAIGRRDFSVMTAIQF
ncbi:DUF6850 family outer membrane beta-barrel protein [Chitinophaga sp. Cy-1792]|uniref:DUF6850 family outer membrane beta-barrel protein n=1 Tax=Chitinophaga sp. Cy-1792 TaxID=2608339 RepID=UPI00142086B4|nr:DUF6850 family outer membrane beta-barrel protein [Chitinophaga sp. Cy-1792]NIG55508.1 hypothetical protein [Chitinophaga sp. Cy-1792]